MDSEEAADMIADCQRLSHKLNDWEVCFIENISELLEHNPDFPFSEAQIDKLEQVWEKATSH